MNALTLARQVRELLAVPERWTRGEFARRADGSPCGSKDPAAQCWCLVGAMCRLDDDPIRGMEMLDAIRAATRSDSASVWNDAPGRTHADVLALLDRVVQRMERDGERP